LLFDEIQTREHIKNALNDSKQSLVVLSAFIKHDAFEWLKEKVMSTDIEVVVVARWRLNDLVSMVSDLSVYKQCQEQGWTFKVDERLHCKLFLIDSSIAFIGSSNLTGAGLGLAEKSNFELSTKIEVTDVDVGKVHKYIDSCRTITDDLYDQMKSFVDSIDSPKRTHCKWPPVIKDLLEQRVDYLWVDELLYTSPGSNDCDDICHDLTLLGVDGFDVDVDILRAKFTELKLTKWLKNQLLKEESKSLRFGALSSCLHDALLNDPRPYRKEVKDFQANLFNWLRYLDLPELSLTKYNVSESISLKDDSSST